MSRQAQLALSLLISAALAAPVLAQGQAVSRGSTGGSSSGSSSGGSSGGGSGSSSSGTEARSGGASTPTLPDRPTASSSQGSGQRTKPTGSTSTGSASTRSGGDSRVSGGSTTSSGGDSRGTATRGTAGSAGNVGVVSGQRNRGDRPIVGVARDRSAIDSTILPIVIGPWNSWYPWYSGLGWNFGYVTYGPYGYGRSRWLWGPYGWYDPWDYDPYYSPYYYESYDERYSEREPRESRSVGSIRLRANPESAKVYIDGALVGTVDDFNGLRDHLELEGGTHKIELRADGYETYTGEITVKPGKTLTERISLKKK